MNIEIVVNVLYLGDNKFYLSDQCFIYCINFVVIIIKMLKYNIFLGYIVFLINDMQFKFDGEKKICDNFDMGYNILLIV